MCQLFADSVEQLMGLEPPRRAQYIRLLVGEMQRIASHLVFVGSYLVELLARYETSVLVKGIGQEAS
jgi:NADH:ubiquinone oxidoreductase subunit D